MSIGERIRKRRELLGLSQEELAKQLNYKSKSSVHKVETGLTDLPLSKLKEFAKVLKCSAAYLMGWEEEELKIAARNKKPEAWDKFNKLSEDKKKVVTDLINLYFDTEMEEEE